MEDDTQRKDLPYAAEYAKTNRSSCKKCKNLIGQGTLRMSAREPSRFFDGLQDNWFHFNCFWPALKKGDINERSVKGIDWLKWEDQEKVRERIDAHREILGLTKPSSSCPTSDGAGDGNGHELYKSLKVEYAKSNRGKCFGCGSLIDKGVMKYGRKAQFFHFECLFLEGKTFGGEFAEIQGYGNLQPSDQEVLKDALTAFAEEAKKFLDKKEKENIKIEEECMEVDEIIQVAEVARSKHKLAGCEVEVVDIKKAKVMPIRPDEVKKEQLKRQAEILWELRTGFEEHLSVLQMHNLLKMNNQEIPSGKEHLLERISDCALFGRPLRCPKCPQGQIVYSSSQQTYMCTGHMTAWTKCTYTNKNPQRSPLGVPKELSDEIPWLLDAPFNALEHRIYANFADVIVSPSQSFRHLGAGRSSLGVDVEDGHKTSRNMSGVSKSYVKNGTAVDAEFEYAEVAHVHKDKDGSLFQVSLCSADMACNRNSYYKIQLLKHDSRNEFYVFRSWGRVGTNRGGHKTEKFKSENSAKQCFEAIFLEKSGNDWADRKYFKKKPGMLCLIETDYSDIQQEDGRIAPGFTSTLPRPIVEILMMIFDVENMKSALKDYEIDTDRMPLGKLSRNQIMKAYSVLKELQDLMAAPVPDSDKILDASNRFYTLIPHNFGMKAPERLDNTKVLQNKSRMLDSLLEIEIAYGVLKQDDPTDKERDPVDVHYEKLKCKMEVVDKSSTEFKLIQEYAKNTHGQTHATYKLEIIDVIRIDREGESKKFKKNIGNRRLLWHGSGKSNYGGILSQGLRIAPPEAPVSGYMFGKGVYFADMVSKSANYCRVTSNKDDGLLLLADVALGSMHRETVATNHSLKTVTKAKAHSIMGVGMNSPDYSNVHTHPDGYVIPKVVGAPITEAQTLIYNEFIVYDVDQINLRYMVRARFSFNY